VDTTVDYYSLLGIKRSATPTEIKSAYRKMVFRYHPDRNPEDAEAAEKLKSILKAYEILSDSDKRASYDEITRAIFGNETEEAEEKQRKEQFGDNAAKGFHFSQNFKGTVEPQPKCPQCSVVGTEHVVSRKGGSGPSRGKQFILSPFHIIFCTQCGHVYGVIGSSS
jgi:DnaJ-class molecular chaperone